MHSDINLIENLIEIIESIVLTIFGILSIILFFKIWGMTNNIKDIKRLLGNSEETKRNKSRSKFSIGDMVTAKSYNGIMEIIDIYNDGTYNCIDVKSNEIVGVFKENELTKKK